HCGRPLVECGTGIWYRTYHSCSAVVLGFQSDRLSHPVYDHVAEFICVHANHWVNNTVSYIVLEKRGFNIVKDFPPIRVWGTIGFIVAMWTIDLCGWTLRPLQLYVSSISALILGIYAFTMPKCPPARTKRAGGFLSTMGLDAFVLFKKQRMIIFFLFAMLLGAALQITNLFGFTFLN